MGTDCDDTTPTSVRVRGISQQAKAFTVYPVGWSTLLHLLRTGARVSRLHALLQKMLAGLKRRTKLYASHIPLSEVGWDASHAAAWSTRVRPLAKGVRSISHNTVADAGARQIADTLMRNTTITALQ
jgi:hypothetical protein